MPEALTITRAQLEALATKLETLDLTDEERIVLTAVFAVAGPETDAETEAEVAGYQIDPYKPPSLSQGFLNVFQQGGKVGFNPGGKVGSIDIDPQPHI